MIFCWTKSPSSVEILWSHYFRRILFPKKLLKETALYVSLNFFSAVIMPRAIAHFAETDEALGFLEKNYSMLSRVTFTSVKFFLQLKDPRQFITTLCSVAANRLHAGLNKREWSKTWEMIFQTWRFFFTRFLEIADQKEGKKFYFNSIAVSRVLPRQYDRCFR